MEICNGYKVANVEINEKNIFDMKLRTVDIRILIYVSWFVRELRIHDIVIFLRALQAMDRFFKIPFLLLYICNINEMGYNSITSKSSTGAQLMSCP